LLSFSVTVLSVCVYIAVKLTDRVCYGTHGYKTILQGKGYVQMCNILHKFLGRNFGPSLRT